MYNHTGHLLKSFSVNSYQGHCHDNVSVRGVFLPEIAILSKIWPIYCSNRIHIGSFRLNSK